MMNLKPYPEYKDSGVEWLGKIPKHWTTKPLKHWVKMNRCTLPETTSPDTIIQYIDIGSVGIGLLKKQPELMTFGNAPSRARRILHKNDTIISTVRTYLKAVYFVTNDQENLIASTGFAVLTPRLNVNPRLLGYSIQDDFFIERVSANSVGASYPAIVATKLNSMPLAMPIGIEEQRQIARFINAKTHLLNRYIRNKRRLIELLQEQKQAFINDCVTGKMEVKKIVDENGNASFRLEPYAEYKDSGVDWLGKVPKHWVITRIKRKIRNIAEQNSDSKSSDFCLALEHVESWTGKINPPEEAITFESQVKRFQSNDILFGKLRPYLAKVARPDQSGVCVGEFLVLRSFDSKALPEFLEYLLRCASFIYLVNSFTYGAKMPRAEWSSIGNILIPIPSTNEQTQIIHFLKVKTRLIDNAISKAQRQIELIREYRTRLIADVVTGKVDVRNIPVDDIPQDEAFAESEEPENIDESIDIEDTEEDDS